MRSTRDAPISLFRCDRGRVKTCIRLRPLPAGAKSVADSSDPRGVTVQDPSSTRLSEFFFDKVLGPSTTQPACFREVALPLVEHVLQGYNATCFAYGQTGSGKTHSMFGPHAGGPGTKTAASDDEHRGLVFRATEAIFDEAEQQSKDDRQRLTVKVSFCELYLDQIRDLAPAAGKKQYPGPNLELAEDAAGVVTVKGLNQVPVDSLEKLQSIIKSGLALRQTAATASNDVSSRSHTVFTVTVTQPDGRVGRLDLVDLAGSERLRKSESEGERKKETMHINSSLTALGKVVLSLAVGEGGGDGSPHAAQPHVPYRDSKLTRLLKNSLSGNSFTVLLCAINPSAEHHDESINSLQFAHRCSRVQTQPKVNYEAVDPAEQQQRIIKLSNEVAALKSDLESVHAHYQKELEAVGGPDYARQLGPVERSEMSLEHDEEFTRAAGGSFREPHQSAPAPTLTAAGTAPSMAMARGDSARGNPAPVLKRAQTASGRSFSGRRDASASSGEVAKLRERARAAEAEVAMTQETVKALQDRIILMESTFSAEKRALHAERQKLRDTSTEEAQRHAAKLKEADKTHGERYAALNGRFLRLQREMAAVQAVVPAAAGANDAVESAAAAKAARAQSQDKAKWQQDAAKSYKALEANKDALIKNLKEQSQYFLNKKDDELRAFVAEFEAYKKAKEAETEQLAAESEYLHAWAMTMNAVISRVEEGAYVVKERSGLRTLSIPARDKPGSLDVDALRSKAAAARAFLDETSKAMGLDDFDFEAFRDHRRLVEEERAAIEAATLKELSSHPTVEYIRHLEEENLRITKTLAEERKKMSDMRVALNSAQRAEGNGGFGAQPRTSHAVSSRPASGVYTASAQPRPPSSRPATGVTRPALPISVGTMAGANLAAGASAREPLHVAFGATSRVPSGGSSRPVSGVSAGRGRPASSGHRASNVSDISSYATGVGGGDGYGGSGAVRASPRRRSVPGGALTGRPLSGGRPAGSMGYETIRGSGNSLGGAMKGRSASARVGGVNGGRSNLPAIEASLASVDTDNSS